MLSFYKSNWDAASINIVTLSAVESTLRLPETCFPGATLAILICLSHQAFQQLKNYYSLIDSTTKESSHD